MKTILLTCSFCLLMLLAVSTESVAAESSKNKAQPPVHNKANPSLRHREEGRNRLRETNRDNYSDRLCITISRNEAMAQATSQVKGKVVAIALRTKGGSRYYRVRILDEEKRMKTVNIPACR